MKGATVHKGWRHLGVLCATLLLAAGCGGGGGGSGSTEPPPGGGTPPPGGGTPPALAGVLWHGNYALDLVDGTQLAYLSGALPRVLNGDTAALPAPDGSRYGISDYDSGNDETRLSIKRTSDGAVQFTRLYEGYLSAPRPSPTVASQLLVQYQDAPGAPRFYGVVDLASGNVIEVYPADTVAVAWLSDGRVVVLGSSGAVGVGLPGATRTATGQIDLLGRTVIGLAAQPGGTRLLMELRAISGSGNVDGSDLWLSNLDGSNPVRYTRTNISGSGIWSPDGTRITFIVDTGTVCGGSSCIGTCEQWHAPATASELNPLPASPGVAGRFSVRDMQGRTRTLGCGLSGWTP
jgi:hypothetical protein